MARKKKKIKVLGEACTSTATPQTVVTGFVYLHHGPRLGDTCGDKTVRVLHDAARCASFEKVAAASRRRMVGNSSRTSSRSTLTCAWGTPVLTNFLKFRWRSLGSRKSLQVVDVHTCVHKNGSTKKTRGKTWFLHVCLLSGCDVLNLQQRTVPFHFTGLSFYFFGGSFFAIILLLGQGRRKAFRLAEVVGALACIADKKEKRISLNRKLRREGRGRRRGSPPPPFRRHCTHVAIPF